MDQARTRYQAIRKGWDRGVSASDLYHQIVVWMTDFSSVIDAQNEVRAFLERCDRNDSMNDLVEDFLYGTGCIGIRAQFEIP